MPEFYYGDALKKGQKEFRACVSRGQYPYLPALEELLPPKSISPGNGVDLGTVEVPLEFVVGTKSGGRTNVFARNFMPLMSKDSEFASKWMNLCQIHLEEGIRDPVRVYEYMNRFYVEEGNKRVSILKFFGGQTVTAKVTRVMPPQNGLRENTVYYEFVDFYKCSQVNFVEFTKPGSYGQLQEMLGKQPGERWTEEERRSFATSYYYFRQAFEANGGKRLNVTVGDALLAYLKIYGYPSLRRGDTGEIKRAIAKAWEELALQQEKDSSIEVKLDPSEEKPGLLAKVLPKGKPEARKVAFIHDKNPAVSGWTYGHELGRQHVERVFQGEVETTSFFDALDGDPLKVMEQAIEEGSTVLFTTSPRLLPASLRAAVEHPEVLILNCSLNQPHRYIRTYYARMYEAKFIAGAVAGSLAGNNPVGYVCDYPIFGQVAGINAFALGVQMVNPRVKVYLEWSSVWGVDGAVGRLTDRGIRLISSQDMAKMADRGHSSFGLSLVSREEQVNLAVSVWQWGAYYETLIRQIQNKSLQSEYEESSRALNYYWGMSAGVVELRCTDKVPYGTQRLAELLQKGICSGACDPFQGPIYTQDGQKISHTLTTEQIINMDWLVENVSGAIPAYEELNDVGKFTAGIAGVEPATPEAERKAGQA